MQSGMIEASTGAVGTLGKGLRWEARWAWGRGGWKVDYGMEICSGPRTPLKGSEYGT